MQLLDANNCVIKTPEVVEYIYRLVLEEDAITSVVLEVQPDLQLWGQSAMHFSARRIGSGEPVLLKVNVADGQLWWTRELAHAFPELLPRVYGTGERVGDTCLGWVLWERVQGGLHESATRDSLSLA